MIINKKALSLALYSDSGERLIEIAQEHVSLAHDLSFYGRSMTATKREYLTKRINALRQERDEIISRYEQDDLNH